MKIAVVRERSADERRVALVPDVVSRLVRQQIQVVLEQGAGQQAGYSDAEFKAAGAKVEADRQAVFAAGDVIVQVRSGAASDTWKDDLGCMRSGQMLLAMCNPLDDQVPIQAYADAGIGLFALELIPRITRAQSMDVLSSMATVAGYRAVILAANHLPRLFPLLMTAAGTVSPARVLVVGAGVAGLQAIATAKRLGAVVQAYDVRPAVKEQVQSLGAKFVEMELEAAGAEGQGGYAREMDQDFYDRQRKMMAEVVAQSDVVITTAAIPGKASPRLVEEQAVQGMRPGSVIVDLAAERGGNCACTVADQIVDHHGVTILGPTNPTSGAPFHASQMFAQNVFNLLQLLIQDGALAVDRQDEVVAGTLATWEGQVVHPRLNPDAAAAVEQEAAADDGRKRDVKQTEEGGPS